MKNEENIDNQNDQQIWQNLGVLKIKLIVLVGLLLLATSFFVNMKPFTKKEDLKPTTIKTGEKLSPTPTADILTDSQSSQPVIPLKPSVTAPKSFGFIKVIDLPGIGVRASFPEKTKITYFDPKTGYTASFPDGNIQFTLYEYNGGSRREWFSKNIGLSGNIFESFGANNHQGYISYDKDTDGNIYNIYYFSVVRDNKMFVIYTSFQEYNNIWNLEKFKSFVSTVQILELNLQGVERPDQTKVETQRWSDTRKTIWERSDLGLRVTAPEWIESRISKTKKEDGTWEYYDWKRIYPKAELYGSGNEGIAIIGGYMLTISVLDKKYTSKTFDEVMIDTLAGTGFCGSAVDSQSECQNPDYCYTKNEVIQNLLVRKTAKFGPYSGQLRGMNATFNQKNDCRASDTWLIQAKGGQFVLSTIYPDSETIRLEGF